MSDQGSASSMFDVLIIGAGPAGLAAAIAATKAGLTYQVLEKGALVNSLLHYPTEMVFFTTPELMEIGGLPFTSPNDKPSRMEALRYYRRAADTYKLDVVFDETVNGISHDADGFVVESRRQVEEAPDLARQGDRDGHRRLRFPNLIGIPGEDLPHVSHYYTSPHQFYRKHVVIIGGKNSAAEAALDLYRAGARVTIVHRRPALGDSIKYWVKPDIENRIKEGSVDARFNTHVVEITPTGRHRREGRRPRGDPRRRRVPPDRLHLRQPPAARRRRRDRSRHVRSGAQPGDLRDQRQGALRGRGDGGGEGERADLHRERPIPRAGRDRPDFRTAKGIRHQASHEP